MVVGVNLVAAKVLEGRILVSLGTLSIHMKKRYRFGTLSRFHIKDDHIGGLGEKEETFSGTAFFRTWSNFGARKTIFQILEQSTFLEAAKRIFN